LSSGPVCLALLTALFTLVPRFALADGGAGHTDPMAEALLALAAVLVVARVGADLAMRLGQPSVLGELMGGVLLGNLSLVGLDLSFMARDPAIDVFARLGVVLLLFEVGLESTVSQMMRVGGSSLLVAVLGVVTPFALGSGVSAWLAPSASIYTHIFLGATLTATSVGITARVLKDLGQGQSNEARIILGAAVIDDVLGLVILAVVAGLIQAADSGHVLSVLDSAIILAKSLGFLVVALLVGARLSPRLFAAASGLKSSGVLLALALAFCFLLAWSASAIGLAPIVGAFAAGLILEPAHFGDFKERGEKQLEELIHPLTSFLVPVFFVVMGMRTDLRAFFAPGVLALAAALTFVAILGKQACALGVLGGVADRLSVGLGMIPRGEVGLIFANMGLTMSVAGQPVVSQQMFSAIVVMVIITTMITPPLLGWGLGRLKPKAEHALSPS
jgi:Kef-type K+ transport system membrane component KefB